MNPNQSAEVLFRLCIPSSLAEDLRARSRPVEAVKVQVAPLAVAHCLAIENASRAAPDTFDPTFYHAMSDRTKAMLASSGIEALNPIEAFPDDELRRAAVGTFLGQDAVNSLLPIVSPDKFFAMMLSLEMFVLPQQLKDVALAGDDRLFSIVRAHLAQLTGISFSPDSPSIITRPFTDLCAKVVAMAPLLKP